MQKTLIIIGMTAIIIGLLWPWLTSIPFGRLPGDLLFEKGHFRLYLPVTTMILISGLLSLILWLFHR